MSQSKTPYHNWFIFHFCWFLLFVIHRLYFRVDVRGLENIPQQGSFIITANHISNLDPLLLGYVSPRRLSFMAKDALFKSTWLGFIIKHLGAFSIRRGKTDLRSIKESLRRLSQGQALMMFPEGTRRREPRQDIPLKPGAAILASRAQAPILPVYISGTDKGLPPGAKWFRRAHIVINFGKTYFLPSQKNQDIEVLSDQIRSRIYALAPLT